MLWLTRDVEGLSRYLQDQANLDSQLVFRCRHDLERGRYDDAVRKAFLVLEERMRSSMGVESMTGRELALKAFGNGEGPLAKKMRANAARASALRELYAGAFGVFRNPAAHHLDAGFEGEECREIIILVNLLLRQLATIQPKYEKVFQHLDQSIKARLPKEYKLRRTVVSGEKNYYQVFLQDVKSHYEVAFRGRDHYLEIALHFEEKPATNQDLLAYFRKGKRLVRLQESLKTELRAEDWGKTWARVFQQHEWMEPNAASAELIAELLLKFVEVTYDEAKAATLDAKKIIAVQKKPARGAAKVEVPTQDIEHDDVVST
jgi:uncharacterized protein (TIGR02391 family)